MDVSKQKKVYLEILRILAIFAVIFCHTGQYGIHHYLVTDNPANYWLGIFLASVTQFCIPLFLMISGALLLNREESIGYVFRHRVLRIVLATLLAVLVQYAWNYAHDLSLGFDLITFFRLAFEGGGSTTHWFLYSYIAFLLFLPFLQKLVKILPNGYWFLYLFAAWEVIDGICPIIQYFQKWNDTALSLSVGGFVVYSMLGYYLEYCCDESFYQKKNVLMILAGTMVLVLVNMYLNHISLADSQYALFRGSFALVYAFTIFVTVKYICHRWTIPPVVGKIFCFAGAGVFGTYLLEGILRQIFLPIYISLNTIILSYPAVFLWIAACVLTGILISNLFKRIPVVGKII